jgi:peptidoglycan/xylan/chitin deacetylase (PgdA/CDA1 family)
VGLQGITEKTMLTLLANGFDLQSAGHTGDDLRSLTNAQLELELQQSRAIIEETTKQPVFAVLYPQGGVNDRVMEKAAAAGYLLGISAAPERTFTREQFLRVPSFDIAPGLSADDLVKLAKGSQ